jgi:hypothetical protein
VPGPSGLRSAEWGFSELVPEQPLKPRLHSLGEETESSVEVAVCLHECLLRLCVCSWASSRMSVLSASMSACSAFACASVDIARHKTPPRFLLISASAHAHWNTSSQSNARARTHAQPSSSCRPAALPPSTLLTTCWGWNPISASLLILSSWDRFGGGRAASCPRVSRAACHKKKILTSQCPKGIFTK